MRPVATLAFLSCHQQVSTVPSLAALACPDRTLKHKTFETRRNRGSRGRNSILGNFSNFGNLARFSPRLRSGSFSSGSSRILLPCCKHARQIQHPSIPEELLWPSACPTAQTSRILIRTPQRRQIDCLIPGALRDLLWKSAPLNWALPPAELP